MRFATNTALMGASAMIGLITLSGCSSASAFCQAVLDDPQVSATVFTPILPDVVSQQQVDDRIAFMDEVEEIPEELTTDWQIWRDHMASLDIDSGTVELEDAEISAARQALFASSMECR